LSLQNWLNSPGETPPVPPLPVPVPVPPDEVPPDWVPPVDPVEVPPVPVAGAEDWGWAWVVVPAPDDDWPWVCVWSVEVVLDWSVDVVSPLLVLELPLALWASASAPGGGASAGTVEGTTSWVASSLPQALRPRHATARMTTAYVRM